MKREEIIEALRGILKRQQGLKGDPDAIQEETPLAQIGFDSLSILDFIYDVEAHFKIRTEVAELVRMERVSDLIRYVESQLSR
jgi:acyl carrier protein